MLDSSQDFAWIVAGSLSAEIYIFQIPNVKLFLFLFCKRCCSFYCEELNLGFQFHLFQSNPFCGSSSLSCFYSYGHFSTFSPVDSLWARKYDTLPFQCRRTLQVVLTMVEMPVTIIIFYKPDQTEEGAIVFIGMVMNSIPRCLCVYWLHQRIPFHHNQYISDLAVHQNTK